MRYFVTGATGFVGSHLVRQLLPAGHQVVALVRDPARARGLAGAELVRGDVTDPDSLRGPMQGVDGVFHVAGWYKVGTSDKAEGTRVNVDGTRNVLEALRELSIPKAVYTSTLAVHSDTHGQLVDESYRFHGRHITHYDLTKAQAHAVAEDFIRDGLPLVIVQPGVVYGPGDTSQLGRTMRDRRVPASPPVTYCWAHVDDVARGHVLAMEKGRVGESYHLAGPVHTFAEAMAIRRRVTGWSAPPVRLPAGPLRVLASVVPAELLRSIAGVSYIASSEKARRELGWEARPLEQGLRETFGG